MSKVIQRVVIQNRYNRNSYKKNSVVARKGYVIFLSGKKVPKAINLSKFIKMRMKSIAVW